MFLPAKSGFTRDATIAPRHHPRKLTREGHIISPPSVETTIKFHYFPIYRRRATHARRRIDTDPDAIGAIRECVYVFRANFMNNKDAAPQVLNRAHIFSNVYTHLSRV